MSDTLKILIQADLNKGLSVKSINESIQAISKHPSLQKIKVKLDVDIDTSFVKILDEFANNLKKIAQVTDVQSSVTNNVTQKIKNETEAINQQTKAVESLLRVQERFNGVKEKIGESITTGSKYQSVTENRYINPDGTIKTIGYTSNYNAEKERADAEKLANQIADGRIKAQEKFAKQQESQRKKEIDAAHAEAKELNDLANQMAEFRIKSQERVRNFEKQWNENQQAQIQKNAEIERAEIAKIQKSRQAYEDWWSKALKNRDISDAVKKTKTQEELLKATRSNLLQEEREYQNFVNKVKKDYDDLQASIRRNLLQEERDTENFVNKAKKQYDSLIKKQEDLILKIGEYQRRYSGDKNLVSNLNNLAVDAKSLNLAQNGEQVLNKLNHRLNEYVNQAKSATSHSISLREALSTAFQKFPIWMVTATAFYAPFRGLQSAIDMVVQLDSQMVELKRVMDQDTNFENMLRGSIELANELGRSITTVNEAMIGFARQGFSEDQVLALTRTATLATNISELSGKEAMDAMTAAMTIFNIEASKSIRIVDALNEVDNNFAVTTKDLAISLMKAGSTAKTFGVTMEETIGDATSIMLATRESGAIAGNALKTIYSRLTTMQPAIDALASIGINVKNASGEMKSATEIIDEYSSKFNSLTKEEQQNTAVVLAGRYQLSRFLAMVQNRAEAHKATQTALHSENSAMRENAKYMESLQARIEKLKAAWQEFSLTIGEAVINDGIIAIVGSLTSLANTFSGAVSTIGFLPIILGAVGVAAAGLNRNFRTLTISVLTLGKGIDALGVSSAKAKVALRGLVASTVVGAAFVALGIALEGVIRNWSELQQVKEKQEQQDKISIQSLSSQEDKVRFLAERYKELSSIINPTREQTEELLKIQNELNDLMPSYTAGIDATGQAHLKSAEAIELETERLKELQNQRDKANTDNFDKNARKQIREIFQNIESAALNRSYLDTLGFALSEKAKTGLLNDISKIDFKNKEIFLKLAGDIEEYNKSVLRTKGSIDALTKEDQNAIKEKIKLGMETVKNTKSNESMIDSYQNLKRETEEYSQKIVELRNQVGNVGNIFSFDELKLMSPEQLDFISRLSKKNIESADSWNAQRRSMLSAGFTLEQVNKIIDAGIKALFNQKAAIDAASGAMEDSNDVNQESLNKHEELYKKIGDTFSRINTLASAYQKLQEGQQLSLDETLNLMEKYPELIDYLSEHNGIIQDRGAILQWVAEKERKAHLAEQQRLLDSVNNTYNALEAKRKMYEIFYTKINPLLVSESFTSKWGNPTGVTEDNNFLFADSYKGKKFGLTEADEKALKDAEKRKKELEVVIALLSQPIDLATYGGNKPKKERDKQDTQATLHTLTDFTKEEINNINQVISARDNNIKSLERQINIADKTGNYNKIIEFTNQLLNEQKSKIDDINTANSRLSSSANNIRSTYQSLADQFAKDGIGFDAWFNDDATASKVFIKTIQDIDKTIQKIEGDGLNLTDTQKVQIKKLENQKSLYEKIFSQIQSIKQAWNGNTEEIQKISDAIDGLSEKVVDAKFNFSKSWIENSKAFGMLDLEGELAAWKRMLENHKDNEQDIQYMREANAAKRKEIEKEIFKLSWELLKQTIDKSVEEVKKYDDQLEISKDRIGLLKEESREYAEELQNQIQILQNKLKAEEAHEQVIRKQMETVGLTQQQWNELNQQLKQSILAQIDIASSIKSTNQSLKEQLNTLSDDVVDIYKEMYKKQKEVALKGIENEQKALEKSHQRKINMLDEEMKKYDELVQARLKALDEQANEEDYQQQLTKLTKERDEIQKEIDKRKLDTSLENKAKTAELLKQLQEKNEEIDDFQKKHLREAAKKALQEQLADKQKSIDSQKEIEDKAYENEKERLDNLREVTDQYYENLIQDERKYRQIREEIQRGYFDRVKADLRQFATFTQNNSQIIGQSISNNLIDKIDDASKRIGETSTIFNTTFSNMATNLQDTMISKVDQLISKFKDLDNLKFGNLTSQLGDINKTIEQMKQNSINWYNSNNEDQQKLSQENQRLGSSIGATMDSNGEWVKDGKQLYSIYYQPKEEEKPKIEKMKENSKLWNSADATRKKELEQANQWMGQQIGATYKNGTWFKNGLPLYHSGGIVGGKSIPLIEKLHKMFNLGSDEELSILKKGELVIKNKPVDIISKLINKIKTPDFSNFSLSPRAVTAGNNVYHDYTFRIDKVIGDKKGAESFVEEVFKNMKNKGKV
ncbi:phage tail tape measure protein [Paenibacillus naphthalenovorans]|uniref:Phage-related minor tail protein n=1 Tax=Paenibacillus naphthalenovorans TaxID=162209 RepID=A0A0U2UGM3_9BACL|nr:phage tail tape measure protein [Paenibacillus naphthalenovorans]ALS22316.1 phage-related minor tail protein [Paenibacillus naphthalenovorans]